MIIEMKHLNKEIEDTIKKEQNGNYKPEKYSKLSLEERMKMRQDSKERKTETSGAQKKMTHSYHDWPNM